MENKTGRDITENETRQPYGTGVRCGTGSLVLLLPILDRKKWRDPFTRACTQAVGILVMVVGCAAKHRYIVGIFDALSAPIQVGICRSMDEAS